MLYILPTPIGNLQDITLRTMEMFRSLSVFFCEDTRTFKNLLSKYEIDFSNKTFHSLTSYTKQHQKEYYISLLQKEDIWLVSEAGCPWLSDPWKTLLFLAIEHNIQYSILPWANALIPAVVGAWFPTQNFTFLGFLPTKKWRKTIFKQIINSSIPCFFYESVHRIEKTIKQLSDEWFLWQISIWREISKLHEQYRTWNIQDCINDLQNWNIKKKWEFVIWTWNW